MQYQKLCERIGFKSMANNMGYELSKKEIQTFLSSLTNNILLGESIILLDTVDSTNDEAKRQYWTGDVLDCESNDILSVVIANEQTKGKGRLGRNFDSPKDSGLYISIVVPAPLNSNISILITTMTCAVVNKVFEDLLGISTKIKWVNDIYLDNKKVTGVLVEGISDENSSKLESVVIGIGINCYTKAFSKVAGDRAGSLSLAPFSRNELAAHIIAGIERLMIDMSWFDFGNPTEKQISYLEYYKSNSMILDKIVRILNSDKIGKAIGIGDDGGLIVQFPDGEVEKITSGEVSIQISL